MSGVKAAHDLFLSTGALGYFAAGDFRNIGHGLQDLTVGSLNGAFDGDSRFFENAGDSIGELTNTMGTAMFNTYFAAHSVKAFGAGAQEGMAFNGQVYQQMESGAYRGYGSLRNGAAPNSGLANPLRLNSYQIHGGAGGVPGAAGPHTPFLPKGFKGGLKGVIKNGVEGGGSKFPVAPKMGQFTAEMGMKRGMGWFGGIMLAGAAAKAALGFAGKIIDEASYQDRRARMVNYDTRFIRGAQQDAMSNYQLLGAGMGAQQQVMVNTARIYHSR
jgi:hypothetical protein